jgi:hypothetical protein
MSRYDLVIKNRNEILAVAARYGIEDIRVFGSVARREVREDGDVDFLVDLPEGSPILLRAVFRRELAGILGDEIEMVAADELDGEELLVIVRDAVPL